ncbi:MAG: amino acid ABC transporter substrate-binding protein [Desulfobacteraceae bacterium 4572_88]|nr:MAG: amino acid ABC transporter substrate-binding protein [Desulfobacteraceae bacterium 4572_88]RLC20916.1 MAG: amino acid ABC transporter substrate-binding protein [Deltaproteobacteria bacterium]
MRKWYKKLAFAVALVFLFGALGTASADTLQDILQRGELRVAVQTQGPPFSFVDKNGKRTGSSIAFCELMAEEMGVKLKFLDYDWDGLIPALLSGKADVLAADMTANLKRAMKVSFTDPFYYSGTIIFTKKDSPFKTIEDCNKEDVTVALLLGGTGEADAKRFIPKAKPKTYKGGGPLLINAVMSGHADIGVNDESAVTGQLAEFPPDSIRILDVKMSQQPLAFAVRPDETHLLQWINLFFRWIHEDGRYDTNINYWVKSLDWKKDH